MLRGSFGRYAQRLGVIVSALPIVLSASANAGAILQINRPSDGATIACCAGVADECVASQPPSTSSALLAMFVGTSPMSGTHVAGVHSLDSCNSVVAAAHLFNRSAGAGFAPTLQSRGRAWFAPGSMLASERELPSDDGEQLSVFTFDPGVDAANLTALNFHDSAAFDLNFIVRFRDFDDGISDRVAAMVVPLPSAFALGVAGLAGVIFASRRIARRSGQW